MRPGARRANPDGSQPGILLKCPTCVGKDYYAVLKTSSTRVLVCPSCGRQTVVSLGHETRCVCAAASIMVKRSVCPNCHDELVPGGVRVGQQSVTR